MSDRAKLAVVVPAYNAERTLMKTARSILGQSFRDIELWIVDDGSTDGTAALADEIARDDSRVHVIHQSNSGCYLARLSGLRRMNADYFGFVDADDTISPDMYAKMLDFAAANDLDVVKIDLSSECVPGEPTVLKKREDVLDVIEDLLVLGRGGALVWDKIFRNQYDFETFLEGSFGTFEDYVFNLQFFLPVLRYGHLHEGLYHYYVNPAAATKNYRPRELENLNVVCELRRKLLGRYEPRIANGLGDPRWVRIQFVNFLYRAATARSGSFAQSCRNVAEIRRSQQLAGLIDEIEWKYRIVLSTRLPSVAVIVIFRMIRLLHRMGRGWLYRRGK